MEKRFMERQDYQDFTLFLDRDGVINERIRGSYVRHPAEFRFLPDVLEALRHLATIFPRIVVVTNQQGIGKGLMTAFDLFEVHQYMLSQVQKAGGRLDAVYYCPHLAEDDPYCRKPRPGMAHQALADFPSILFEKSIMVGDSISDMEFAQRLGMQTVYVETKEEELEWGKDLEVDFRVKGLGEFVRMIPSY